MQLPGEAQERLERLLGLHGQRDDELPRVDRAVHRLAAQVPPEPADT